jgi:archaellum biogenesis ATPase FlaH
MAITNTHQEKIFYHFILNDPSTYIHAAKAKYFSDETIKTCLEISKEFYDKYNDIPTKNQVIELLKVKSADVEVDEGAIDVLYKVELSDYDPDWTKENTECFIEYKTLYESVVDTVTLLKSTPVSSDNIKELINKVKTLVVNKNSLNFSFEDGLDFFDASSHIQPTWNTFSTGYTFMDLVAGGGFAAKTLTVFAGQQKIGKSIWLANIATNAVRAGHNVAMISLEMGDRAYIKRLGANLLNIKVSEYAEMAQNQEEIKKRIKNLNFQNLTVLPGKLIIKEYPASSASAIDIESYLLKEEEKRGIKFKIVVIDYLNIMKNWRNPNSENTYMKVKQIAEDVRAMGQRNEWALVSATQTSKGQFDSTDMGITDIAESSGLGATVDLMFGIIQDPMMYTAMKYKLKCLLNRSEGLKNASKIFNIDYSYMKITEDMTSQIFEG